MRWCRWCWNFCLIFFALSHLVAGMCSWPDRSRKPCNHRMMNILSFKGATYLWSTIVFLHAQVSLATHTHILELQALLLPLLIDRFVSPSIHSNSRSMSTHKPHLCVWVCGRQSAIIQLLASYLRPTHVSSMAQQVNELDRSFADSSYYTLKRSAVTTKEIGEIDDIEHIGWPTTNSTN